MSRRVIEDAGGDVRASESKSIWSDKVGEPLKDLLLGCAASRLELEHASVDVKNIPSQHATCYVSMCLAQHVNFDASAWTPTILDGHLADSGQTWTDLDGPGHLADWNLDARTDLDRL